MGSEEKWSCVQCTYDNFPASIKCTICLLPRYTKSQHLDGQGGMCSSQCDHQEQSLLIIPPSPSNKSKHTSSSFSDINESDEATQVLKNYWTCKSCSYQNSFNTYWCSNCHYNRDAIADMNNQNLKHSENLLSISNDDSKSNSVSKWACPCCTYLNWNSSKSCVMCKFSKETADIEMNNNEHSIQNSINKSETQNSVANKSNHTEAKNTNSVNKSCLEVQLLKGPIKNESSVNAVEVVLNKDTSNIDWKRSISQSSNESNEDLTLKLSSSRNTNMKCEKKQDLSTPTSSHVPTCSSEINVPTNFVYSKSLRGADYRLYKKRKRSQLNRLFIKACIGVVENHIEPVTDYIANGGNISRAITSEEAKILNRPSAFDSGFTLVHLAVRFRRQNILTFLLDPKISVKSFKRNPSNLSPETADVIQREIISSLRRGKDDFCCKFFSEFTTFQLPTEIYELPNSVSKILFSELIDEHAQKELEDDLAINWMTRIEKNHLSCQLYALWNRSAGDCLLDSVLQSTWGVFDSNNTLRSAMSQSLHDCSTKFFCRWKEWETSQARLMGFTFNDRQCISAWSTIHELAQQVSHVSTRSITSFFILQPGASLEHCHIFTLSHILRRPIIVYGIKYLKSYQGDTLGFAKFQGVYLPLFWDRSFCYTSPIALGYTRGHFTALVSMDTTNDSPDSIMETVNFNQRSSYNRVVHLPLNDWEGNLLPLHFTTQGQATTESQRRQMLFDWMDCHMTDDNVLVAKQLLGKRPPSVTRMLDEWLDHYRHLSFQHLHQSDGNSSEGENDEGD